MDDKNIQNEREGASVQEGEVITEEAGTVESTTADTNDAIVLLNLESLVKSHAARIDKIGNEMREQSDTLNNILLNDPTYKEHADAAKEANKIKTATKAQVLRRPDVAHVDAKLKEMRQELKEKKEELSDYLREYQRMSGANEIEIDDEIREIILNPKLVRRGSRNQK